MGGNIDREWASAGSLEAREHEAGVAMDRPFRTGLRFGAGLWLTLVGFLAIVVLISKLVDKYWMDESVKSLEQLQVWNEKPTVVRAQPELRAGQIVILITVRNDQDVPIRFGAEAVIFGRDGAYYDTCPVARSFRLKSREELSFRADCPTYGVTQDLTMSTLGSVKVQFMDPLTPDPPTRQSAG